MGTTAQKLQAIVDSKADIADAIEEKGGTVPTKLADYGDAIRDLPTGLEKDSYPVEFIDYDGKLLYGYTLEEVAEWTSDADLPPLPEREGFTNQGWNYDEAQVKSTAAALKGVTVGCYYITEDDKTRLNIVIDSPEYAEFAFYLTTDVASSRVSIDWGDLDSVTMSGNANTILHPSHTYSPSSYPARYTIEITVLAGSYRFKNNIITGSDSFNQGSTKDPVTVKNSMIESYELGSSPTGLGQSFARSNMRLKAISIPKTTKVWGSAFIDCVSLTGFVYPLIIGNGVPLDPTKSSQVGSITGGCRSLKRVSLPFSMNTNGGQYFNNCSSLRKVNFPQSASIFDNWLNQMNGCTALEEVNMPVVSTVGTQCFYNCDALKTLRMGGTDLFPHCVLPAAVIGVNATAFRKCLLVDSFEFSRISVIKNDTLHDCYNLKKIVVPNSVSTIEASAFAGCMGVTVFDFTAFDAHVTRDLTTTTDLDINFQDGTTHIYYSNGELITEAYGQTYHSSPSLVFVQSDWSDYLLPVDFVPQGDPTQDSSPTNISDTWFVWLNNGTWLMSQGAVIGFPVSGTSVDISSAQGASTVSSYTGSLGLSNGIVGVPTLANTNAFSLTSDSKKIVVRDSAYDAFRASNNWGTDETNYKIKSCITKQSEA